MLENYKNKMIPKFVFNFIIFNGFEIILQKIEFFYRLKTHSENKKLKD